MLQPVRASVPTVFGRPGGPRRHALALAAAGWLAAPASHALQVFTGNAPVYVGAWFNGVTTEVQEFQFALDWAGWCNASA